MQIGNKMRAGALITLAFFLMMLTSLFTVGLSKSKPKSEAKKTEISKKEKPAKKKKPENKKDKIKAKKDKTKSEKKESLVNPREINLEKPDLAESQKPAIKDTNIKNDVEQDHHIATWYDLHGRKTSSGQRMHRDSATAAYNHVPLGTRLLVTNTRNNKSCVVKVTDRMGHTTKKTKYIDLSKAAFGFLSHHGAGRIIVTIKHL
jgi:rare lipoprotein A (peptidoglycan hydrolase)